MIELGSMDISEYIQDDLNSEPRHNCESLAKAINDISRELEFDSFRIMHTANGREIINTLIDKYYEYESTN